jgi:hypothetical protein
MMRGVRTLSLLLLALSLSVSPVAFAQTEVTAPAGTQVPLSFATRVDSNAVREGEAVPFTVAQDVVVERKVIVKKGTSAQGLITSVSPPGIFGKSARVHIDFINTLGVDGLPIKLSPVDITPENFREAKDTGGAVGTSVAGLILLGPVGLAAGALIRGGHVVVPAGVVAITATLAVNHIKVP